MSTESSLQGIFGEHPYATLVAEICDFAIYLLDTENRIVSWNEGARLIFGYEREEILGQSGAGLFLLEDQRKGVPQHELETAQRDGRAEDVRWHLKKDGRRFWANGVTTALLDGEGQLRGFAKVTRDDTQRKLIEDDLRQSQERFDLVARATNDVIWDWDLQTDILWWNSNLQTVFGFEPDPANSSAAWWKARVHTEDRERVVESIHQAIGRGGQLWSSQYRFERADGSFANIFDRGFAVHDASGRPVRMLGTMTDVSARQKSEAEREELLKQLDFERRRLATIFQNAPAFAAILRGPLHVYELANPAYLQLVGHRDIIGKPLLEALPEIEGQGFVEILDRVLASGESVEHRGVLVLLQREPEGPLEERFVDLLYQPLLEADGTVSGVFSHGVDITEQVHARRVAEEASQQAEAANRVKDEFLATLSHELRSPLTAIMGWTNILQSEQASSAEMARGLSIIERNARAQAQLVEDILDVSRVVTGKMRLEAQPVDLTSVIEGAVSSVVPAAQAKEIRLQRTLDSGPILVLGDPVRLQQIVWNLLSNALKFTPKQGRVHIRLERVGSHVEIVVSDSGMGIAPQVLPLIFDRFRQGDSSSTRTHGGLGLGLAIVRHLTELQGGSVEAHSEGLGQGATFTVRLPVAAVRSPQGPQTDAPQSALSTNDVQSVPANIPRIEGLHVLVVDDQEDTRVLLAVVLEKLGARVTAVESVAEALPALQQLRPDVLISDIGMPGEDGFTLIQRVRALPPEQGGQTPAAALTAFARVEDRVKALRTGFQNHLSKPIEPMELVSVIATLAGRHGKS